MKGLASLKKSTKTMNNSSDYSIKYVEIKEMPLSDKSHGAKGHDDAEGNKRLLS